MGQLILHQACISFVDEIAGAIEANTTIAAKELEKIFRASHYYYPSYESYSAQTVLLALGQAVSRSKYWKRISKGIYQCTGYSTDLDSYELLQTEAASSIELEVLVDNVQNNEQDSTTYEAEAIENDKQEIMNREAVENDEQENTKQEAVESNANETIEQQVKRYGWNEQRKQIIDSISADLYKIISIKAKLEPHKLRKHELQISKLKELLQMIIKHAFSLHQLEVSKASRCDFISYEAQRHLQKSKKKKALVLDFVIPCEVYLAKIKAKALDGSLTKNYVKRLLMEQLYTCLIKKSELKKLLQLDMNEDQEYHSLLYRYHKTGITVIHNKWTKAEIE